jgi:hypothetical protein
LSPNDAVVAVGTNDDLSLLFGSESGIQIPSAVGFANQDPYDFLTVVDPNGAPDDIGINLAENYGTLNPGQARTVTWDMVFGSSAANVINTFGLGTASGIPPSILVPPQGSTNVVGTSAMFNVTASGSAPLHYQWQHNGAALGDGPRITGSLSSNLTLANLVLSDAGNYQVVVTNVYGSVTSAVAALAIYTPTTILQPPANAQVTVGGTAAFHVLALSSSPLSYQWFFGNVAIPGATNSSYSVVNAQLTNAGAYMVQVTNLAGSVASASAALIVLPAPPPLVPTFSYSINIQTGINLIANQLDQGGDTLHEIMPVVPDGTVVSKYDNASGTWSSASFNAASGAWNPSSIILRPGEGAELISPTNFTLTFTGTPHVPVLPVTIPGGAAWLVSRQTNAVGTYENILGTSPAAGAVVYKWNPGIQAYTVYNYSSEGWSGGSAPTAAVGESLWIGPAGGAPVEVPEPPAIIQQPTNVIAALGGSATFTVLASGSEPLSYQWQLNGNAIQGATDNVLQLLNVQATNQGNYSVVVFNSIGVINSSNAMLTIPGIGSLPVADDFENAGDLSPASGGIGTASNVGATTEDGEPEPGAIPFGSSVWLQWQPAVSGIASLATLGSGFDSVLGVFVSPTNPPSLQGLQPVAADDDSGPALSAALNFNVTAGVTYYIQISGFHGAQGSIVLSWDIAPTSVQVPVIIVQPASQTQTNGGPVTLSVVATNTAPGVFYQWSLNGAALPGETNSTLTIPNLSSAQIGLYVVGVTNIESFAGVASAPASVDIFNPGLGQPGNFANVHPNDKFFNATALTPHDPNIPNDPSFAGGFTGTQIFTSLGSTADLGEPNHCGNPPCHSVWYSYKPPTTGILIINATNNFNAVLEVYSGPGTSFTNLVSLACSTGNSTTGESASFGVIAGTNYWIVIDGVNCDSGNFGIFYTLSSPPAFTVLPAGQTVNNGTLFKLTASTAGTPPFGYQWKLNGAMLQGATNSALTIPNFQGANQGNYTVITKNAYGTNESAPAMLLLSSPPRFVSFGVVNGSVSAQYAGAANTNYVFQTSSNMSTWTPVATNNSPNGIVNFFDSVNPSVPGRFYRATTK